MKKFVSLCAFVAALSFVSCGGTTTATEADSVVADSAVVDSAVIEQVVDSAAVVADSALAVVDSLVK